VQAEPELLLTTSPFRSHQCRL